ncbi:MAG: 50S ribosomal protein L10 [Candidatus Saccharibacteria bacterium]|nr:50S ribosomal protein L10 [Candidatus Saccharibacteria bacterium]MCY4089103.1 50S ribosomal protein L10 [Candidatus Saccharibacteria bacterium]
MAISRSQKETIIEEVKNLFRTSKLTVLVYYEGLTVSEFQNLRSQARKSEVTLKVIKNRLVKQALKQSAKTDSVVADQLKGMLLYVFSSSDEIIGAQIIKNFAKTSKANLDFVGAISEAGNFLAKEQVAQLANLAPKPQLIAQTGAYLLSPLTQLQNILAGRLPQLLNNLKLNKI